MFILGNHLRETTQEGLVGGVLVDDHEISTVSDKRKGKSEGSEPEIGNYS